MNPSVILTLLGADEPGIVKLVSDRVAASGGNWLESRMARMAGHFAGIVRIECPAEILEQLCRELEGLGENGLVVTLTRDLAVPGKPDEKRISIDVIGNDRPGIVRDLTAHIARLGGNLLDFSTELESAPMMGYPIFRARGVVGVAADFERTTLVEALEELGGDLSVEIS